MAERHIADKESKFVAVNGPPDFCIVGKDCIPFDISDKLSKARDPSCAPRLCRPNPNGAAKKKAKSCKTITKPTAKPWPTTRWAKRPNRPQRCATKCSKTLQMRRVTSKQRCKWPERVAACKTWPRPAKRAPAPTTCYRRPTAKCCAPARQRRRSLA